MPDLHKILRILERSEHAPLLMHCINKVGWTQCYNADANCISKLPQPNHWCEERKGSTPFQRFLKVTKYSTDYWLDLDPSLKLYSTHQHLNVNRVFKKSEWYCRAHAAENLSASIQISFMGTELSCPQWLSCGWGKHNWMLLTQRVSQLT